MLAPTSQALSAYLKLCLFLEWKNRTVFSEKQALSLYEIMILKEAKVRRALAKISLVY